MKLRQYHCKKSANILLGSHFFTLCCHGMTKYHHKTLKQKTMQWAPFLMSTARYQIKIEVHITAAACQGPFHRVPVPIKPHYFQGHHFLPNGVAITTYLLVNNNKKDTLLSHPIEMEKAEMAEKKSRQGAREIFQGQFHSAERPSRGRPPAVTQQPS